MSGQLTFFGCWPSPAPTVEEIEEQARHEDAERARQHKLQQLEECALGCPRALLFEPCEGCKLGKQCEEDET